ncbi:hypothetical protein PY092_12640 [Muricauda sp. 334s03]|uniref:Uncharacterized protein n=1 Tax=Flagellimonas yonaguniensis TaxID=3031325 RepID=A0ABT5Y0N9_9FLAO|nr:hypothetical protein [[Muricauda] yonaguniensis]MDF0717002.1 hypothetical protein [[Muricauda] yonaguniensis]
MKTYVLLFLMILNVGLLSAQNSNNEKCLKKDSTAIVLNPFGENQIPKFIQYKAWVKYRIDNVNNILVEGVSESKSTNIDFEIPDIISGALEGPEKIDLGNIAEMYEPGALDDIDINVTKHQIFSSLLRIFINEYRKIDGYSKLDGQLVALLNDNLFIQNAKGFKEHAGSIVQSYFDEDSIPILYRKLPQALNTLEVAYFQLKRLYEEINEKKEIGTMSVSLRFKSGEKRNIEDMSVVDLSQPKFKTEYDFVKKAYEELHKKENKQNLENKVNAGIRLYQKIDDACFTIYGDAGHATGDVFTAKIALKNAKGDTLHTYKPITLKTKGGVKVNFSSGYMLSFKGNESYSSFRASDSSATSIKANNKDKMTHALGALVHVYPRGFKDIQPGISAGLSVEDDADLGFYLGLSALFTESNRFVLTAGVSMTKIDKLNTANLSDVSNGIRTFISEDNTNINYDKVYRPAFFVGVTFNLSKPESTNN